MTDTYRKAKLCQHPRGSPDKLSMCMQREGNFRNEAKVWKKPLGLPVTCICAAS